MLAQTLLSEQQDRMLSDTQPALPSVSRRSAGLLHELPYQLDGQLDGTS